MWPVGGNFEIGRSLISNPKFRNFELDLAIDRVQFAIWKFRGLRLGFVQFQNCLPTVFEWSSMLEPSARRGILRDHNYEYWYNFGNVSWGSLLDARACDASFDCWCLRQRPRGDHRRGRRGVPFRQP